MALCVSAVATETVVGVAGQVVKLPCRLEEARQSGVEVCWGRGQPSLFTCHNTLINGAGGQVTYRQSDRYATDGHTVAFRSRKILIAPERFKLFKETKMFIWLSSPHHASEWGGVLLSSVGSRCPPPPPLCPSLGLSSQMLVSITAEFSCPDPSTTKRPPSTSSSSAVRSLLRLWFWWCRLLRLQLLAWIVLPSAVLQLDLWPPNVWAAKMWRSSTHQTPQRVGAIWSESRRLLKGAVLC